MSHTYRAGMQKRRRRRKSITPLLILLVAILSLLLIVLIVMSVRMSDKTEKPELTAPPATENHTVTEEPETTEPKPTTPMDELEAFTREHGLSIDQYPEKMLELLERNAEAREYVLNFPLEYGKEHEVDISGYADYEGVPLFIQWDEQWGYRDYVGSYAGLAACGPTSLSMIMYYFTRDPKMTPVYMMEFAEENQYATLGGGTEWTLFSQGAKKLGLNTKELTAEQMGSEEKVAQILQSGRIIAMNVKPGIFTTVGHYMLLVGYEDGKFRINDPNSRANSERLWDYEEFIGDVRIMWSFSYE